MKFVKTCLRTLMGSVLLLPVAAQSAEFSIVVIPDTQMYVEQHPEVFEAQIDWIVANEVAESIIYVAHLGDPCCRVVNEEAEREDAAQKVSV